MKKLLTTAIAVSLLALAIPSRADVGIETIATFSSPEQTDGLKKQVINPLPPELVAQINRLNALLASNNPSQLTPNGITTNNIGTNNVRCLSQIIQGPDDYIYGFASVDGTNLAGTVFKLSLSGTRTIIHTFTGNDGLIYAGGPNGGGAPCLEGSVLYGVASLGGPSFQGSIFKLDTNGNNFGVLHYFQNVDTNGAEPVGTLICPLHNGILYGTTLGGGGQNLIGGIFSMNTNGAMLWATNLPLNGTNGGYPWAGLTYSHVDGWLYGTTTTYGPHGDGTLFKVRTNGTGFTIVYSFTGTSDGYNPFFGVTEGTDGNLHGATIYGNPFTGGAQYSYNVTTGTMTIQRSWPLAIGGTNYVIPGKFATRRDGLLVGTTENGGTYTNGTVFLTYMDGSSYCEAASFRTNTGNFLPYSPIILHDGRIAAPCRSNFNPTNYGSIVAFSMPEKPVITDEYVSCGGTTIGWLSVAGQYYKMQVSTNLSDWTTVQDFTMATAGTSYVTDIINTATNRIHAYYRIVSDLSGIPVNYPTNRSVIPPLSMVIDSSGCAFLGDTNGTSTGGTNNGPPPFP